MVLPSMKSRHTTDTTRHGEGRLPGLEWLPEGARLLLIASLGEFVGTFLFLFFAFAATQVANNLLGEQPMDIQTLMYICLAFGFSLAVNVWMFFRISGGLFNPAVTLALAIIGAVPWFKAAILAVVQVIAAIASAAVVNGLFPGPLTVRTSLSADTSVVRGLFIEMFLTAELIFCIFMLAAEKHKATFLAPIGIGLALFVAELAGVIFTGGSLNPARSFGPDVVLHKFDGSHWIYWVGPVLGAVLAVIFYHLVKILEYESANPGADGDGQQPQRVHSGSYDGRHSAHGTTDGTNEVNFASRFQAAKGQPFAYSHHDDMSIAMNEYPKPSHPAPIFQHGGDAHRSYSDFNSFSHNPARSSNTQYRGEADEYYRNGPSIESGRASSLSSSSSSSSSSSASRSSA